MIKVPINLFDRKVWFTTYLARYFSDIVFCFIVFFNCCTAVTKILFILRHFMQSITSQMKTSVAQVTVKNLIRIRIKTAKTYFTISLKKLFSVRLTGFSGFYHFHILQKLFNHLVSFIFCSMLNVT